MLTNSRSLQPAVQRNPFRRRRYETETVPSFSEARAHLPEPHLPAWPGWEEMYWRAWELVWSNLRRPGPGSGFVAPFIDHTTDGHVQLWPSVFMTQYGLYARRAVDLMGMLDNFYARQHDDGFISREINSQTGEEQYGAFDPNGTGPIILAWAEWRYFRMTGDTERLADVFWPLLGLHRWFRAHRTWPSRLYWATGLSSGMENQTRIPESSHYHQHWTWVDANMQAALDCLILEQMATLLDERDLATELAEERAFLGWEMNARLWDEEANFYKDIDPAGQHSQVKSIGAYWGLLVTELIPDGRLGPFVRHLRDSTAFKRPHRIPSQAADSEGYNQINGGYWRGGVWPSTNYMVLKGLRAVGQVGLAHEISVNHLESVWSVFERTNTFWENYSPEAAAPGEPARPNDVGPSALTPIAILLEDVLGINVDWPLRRVVWDRQLPGDYGVRRYPLGPNGRLDLVGNEERVVITTSVPVTLVIQMSAGSVQTAVGAGTTEISLT